MESTGPCITCGSTEAPYVVNTEKGIVCADVRACNERKQARDLYTTPVVYDASLVWCAECGAAKPEHEHGFDPDWVSAPGDTIRDILEERLISHPEFAARMCLSEADADRLLNGDLPITDEIADTLSRELGASLEFWIRREQHYREGLAKRAAPLDPDQTWRNGL